MENAGEIAIEELQNTVAELQAAEEALRQQQDELIKTASRSRWSGSDMQPYLT